MFDEAYKILSRPGSIKTAFTRYEKDAVFIYDAKGSLLYTIQNPAEIAAILTLWENYAVERSDVQAWKNIPKKSLHEGQKLLYRYSFWLSEKPDWELQFHIYIYKNTEKVKEVLYTRYVYNTIFLKEGYELFQNPEKLIQKVKEQTKKSADLDSERRVLKHPHK